MIKALKGLAGGGRSVGKAVDAPAALAGMDVPAADATGAAGASVARKRSNTGAGAVPSARTIREGMSGKGENGQRNQNPAKRQDFRL